MARGLRKIRHSASSRAGLIFPVARVTRKLKNIPQKVARVSKGAGVYLTSVIEYLLGKLGRFYLYLNFI
jgi:histone H3/H4